MHMNRTVLASAVMLSLATGAAFAQSPENDEGLYIGLGYGNFNVKVDDIDDTDEAISTIDDDDNVWKVFAGWRINPYVAFELNYVDFGDTTGTGSSGDYSVELAGFQPAVYGTFPLGPVELFGKVGYYLIDTDVRVDLDDLGSDVFQSDAGEEAWSYGFGIGGTVFDRLNLKLEYEKIELDLIDDFDAIWASAAWRF